jgi:hypothetical protein
MGVNARNIAITYNRTSQYLHIAFDVDKPLNSTSTGNRKLYQFFKALDPHVINAAAQAGHGAFNGFMLQQHPTTQTSPKHDVTLSWGLCPFDQA